MASHAMACEYRSDVPIKIDRCTGGISPDNHAQDTCQDGKHRPSLPSDGRSEQTSAKPAHKSRNRKLFGR